jgi:hypothetical protein
VNSANRSNSVTDDIFKEVESDAFFWVSLRDAIQTSLALLPPLYWRPKLVFPPAQELASNPDEARKAKLAAIRAFGPPAQAAAQAIFHTLRENEWPKLTPPQIWNLTIALEQIVRFLDLCFVPDGQRNLSVFPPLASDKGGKVICWFYFRWWYGVGLPRWLEDVAQDETTFYKYFDRP